MTDPIVPGGAGLPDPQARPDATPPAAPDATPRAAPDATPGASSVWPPTDSMAEPDSAPVAADSGAGFGMPSEGFGAPLGSSWDSPPAGSPAPAPAGTPPAGWAAGAPLKPSRGGRRIKIRYIVIIAVIAIIAIGAYAFRDSLTSQPGELQVGDCFDVPTGAGPEDTIKSVQHHPCTQSHTGEVIFVGDYSGAGSTYPAATDFDTFVGTACNPAFQAYVGIGLDSDPDLSMGYFYPLEDGWANGDHGVTCYVNRTDEGPMTTSIRNSGTSGASATP